MGTAGWANVVGPIRRGSLSFYFAASPYRPATELIVSQPYGTSRAGCYPHPYPCFALCANPSHVHVPARRLEATYEIREDIADVLRRVGAYWDDDSRVRFAGWARMGLPITSFKVRAYTREGQQGGRGARTHTRGAAGGSWCAHTHEGSSRDGVVRAHTKGAAVEVEDERTCTKAGRAWDYPLYIGPERGVGGRRAGH